MITGFYIRKVVAKGERLPTASVELSRGANLITGASDTGKSYIFSLINYVLGRSAKPKEIPEANGYNYFYLEISTYQDEVFTIERELGKKRVLIKKCLAGEFLTSQNKIGTYRAEGSAKTEKNLSDFFLDLCGLSGRKILKSQSVPINLSFKQINDLTSIDEERIITEKSPFYPSGQYMFRVIEQSLLMLLLTNQDFSAVVGGEDPVKRETSLKGKIEYIAGSILSLSSRREGIIKNIIENEEKVKEISSLIDLEKLLSENILASKELLEKKNGLLALKNVSLRKLEYKGELLYRFSVLKKQYIRDKERLEFVLEAESLSSQLGDQVCPVCTSPLDTLHFEHVKEIEGFKVAALEEYQKVERKLSGLDETIENLFQEKKKMDDDLLNIDIAISDMEVQFSENLSPRITDLRSKISDYIAWQDMKKEISYIDVQMNELFAGKRGFETLLSQPEQTDSISIIKYDYLSQLSNFINARLTKWNYEPNVNVIFDSNYSVFDISISGKSRRSYGKGKRAISYTACLLGVLDYCMLTDKPFSNLIILDSPLTTFEGKKGAPPMLQGPNDEVTPDIQEAFFKDLSSTSPNCQVVIFDNKAPDKDYTGLNVVTFTGDLGTGRKGFF